MKNNRLNFVLVLIFVLISHAAFAVEVFCKNLPKATVGITYTREQIQTPSGVKTAFLPYPYQLFKARPSYSSIGAGDRGQNLKAGECGLKSAPFATKFTEINLFFVGGTSFRTVDGPTVELGGWSEVSSSCCKAFSFEADLTMSGTSIRAEVVLSQSPVTFY